MTPFAVLRIRGIEAATAFSNLAGQFRVVTSFVDTPRLPVIDLGLLEAGTPWRDHVAAQIDWAASEFGFFYAFGHGVDSQLIENLHGLSRTFFDSSLETKQQIRMSAAGRAWRGYFPVGGELTSGHPDLKEGIYFGEELGEDDPRVRSGMPLHGRNLFPALPEMRDAVLGYMASLTALGHKVMASIGRGLHLGEEYFADRYTARPTTLFRIFNYPSSRPSVQEQGVGAHTDYGLLTLLHQDEVGGLQIRHGSSWIDVPYLPGTFVINIGDMMERLTSQRYTSALHRVVNRSGRARISMPFFFDPGFDAPLQPIAGIGPVVTRTELGSRWDGTELKETDGSYGEYLMRKVSKVFPELGRHLSDQA